MQQALQHFVEAPKITNNVSRLQEVDLPEIKNDMEEKWGCEGIETLRFSNDGASGAKADSCGI